MGTALGYGKSKGTDQLYLARILNLEARLGLVGSGDSRGNEPSGAGTYGSEKWNK